jgi:hypothetical protein
LHPRFVGHIAGLHGQRGISKVALNDLAARGEGRGDDGKVSPQPSVEAWGYLFSGFLTFTEPTFALPLAVSTAAIRLSALSISAAWRALCDALRWLALRFISFALWGTPHSEFHRPLVRLTAERRLFLVTAPLIERQKMTKNRVRN